LLPTDRSYRTASLTERKELPVSFPVGFGDCASVPGDATGEASMITADTQVDGSFSAPATAIPTGIIHDREVVFSARSITKVYEMGDVRVDALRGVDFEVSAGEFVVLLGPSGSGKSTLLNILGGLDIPSSGEVVYKDHNLTTAGEAALTEYRRTHVGFVFQFYNLIPSLTARENVALVTEIVERPMTPEDALAMVGLAHRLDHFPAQLSGGEQQRVAIARAIAKRPDVLLCDEPTGALDITTGVVVLEAIERVNRELGTATVVITHNAAIAGIADRVVRLFDGRIVGVQRNASKVHARDLQW
jgi:putative ABC transport system ATP-binding protein